MGEGRPPLSEFELRSDLPTVNADGPYRLDMPARRLLTIAPISIRNGQSSSRARLLSIGCDAARRRDDQLPVGAANIGIFAGDAQQRMRFDFRPRLGNR